MNRYWKIIIFCLFAVLSFSYANERIPADLKQIADIAARQYHDLHKLQQAVDESAHRLSVQWIEVFDEKGFVIAHSHPSRVYNRKPLTQPHYNAVISVLHSGHSLIQEGPDEVFEEYYPITFHRRTIGVIEVIKTHD